MNELPKKRKKKTGEPLRPKTIHSYRVLVEQQINPKLGTIRVGDLELRDIEKFHAAQKTTPYQANRALGVVSQLLDLAERLEWRPLNSNPCRHVSKHPEKGRARNQAVMLRPEQIQGLLDAIEEERQQETDPYALAAIELGFWLGWRVRSEVLPLKWEHVDFERKLALLKKTKGEEEEYRALSDEAITILQELAPEVGNPFVFPGKTPGRHRTTVRKIWTRIRRNAGLVDLPGLGAFRLHDLRHNAVSWHLASGADLKLAGRLVGHRSQQSTEIYSHFLTDHLAAAANARSQAMKAALKPAKE